MANVRICTKYTDSRQCVTGQSNTLYKFGMAKIIYRSHLARQPKTHVVIVMGRLLVAEVRRPCKHGLPLLALTRHDSLHRLTNRTTDVWREKQRTTDKSYSPWTKIQCWKNEDRKNPTVVVTSNFYSRNGCQQSTDQALSCWTATATREKSYGGRFLSGVKLPNCSASSARRSG